MTQWNVFCIGQMKTQMRINACRNLPFFFKFADSILKNYPLFLISRIHTSHWKNTPFCENGYEPGRYGAFDRLGLYDKWLSLKVFNLQSADQQSSIKALIYT